MDRPSDWETGVASANGVDLHYYRTGSGPPVVAAHGFGANGRYWEPLADDLAPDYEVVMYDARGHGQSDAPPSGYGLDDRVADLTGLVEALDLADPFLFGHSMGAATVAWAAAKRPALPRGVVLEDPVGWTATDESGADERAAVVAEKLAEAAEKSVEELAAEYDDRDPEQARRLAVADTECSPHVAEIAREGYPAPLADAYADIECPTLVLRRDADVETRADHLDAADSLSNGRVVHVPNAGHHVFYDEYEAALTELRTFLRRH